MLSESELSEDHFSPSVRLVEIGREDGTTLGFHLTRGKWDPYPWVSKIDAGSVAEEVGMMSGDCLLEVNGENIVGKRISDIAMIVKQHQLTTLLLWNAGSIVNCSPETLCCGPMPNNFQRLSAATSSILNHLECPICLDTAQPPVYQCDNGHIICMRCRTKTEKCPVCRIRFSRGRSIIADNVYNSIMNAFDLRNISQDIRTVKINNIFKPKDKSSTKANSTQLSTPSTLPDIKVTQHHARNKFFARLISKASSVDNLSSRTGINGKTINHLAVDSEFNPTMKSKSLSSSEIFSVSASSALSRTSSINAINGMNGSRCSSINSMIDLDDDGLLFVCPFNAECGILFRSAEMQRHFQNVHDGPLIQYFKANLAEKVIEGQSTYLITIDNKHFVLKIIQEVNNRVVDQKNLRIWCWILGNKQMATEYQLHVNLYDDKNNAIFSTRNPIYSLNSVSWFDVKDTKKAIFLNASTLENASDVFIEAEILKYEGQV